MEPIVNDMDLVKREHFTGLLKEEFGTDNCKQFKIESAVGVGENYASSLLRVYIELEEKDKTSINAQFIVKLMLQTGVQSENVKLFKAFPRECEMYEKIIPSIEELYRKCNQPVRFAPKFYKTYENPQMMIMEDLGKSNFRNVSRQQGMDMKHAEIALSKLAKFHAASARLYELQGPYSHVIMDGPFSNDTMRIFKEFQQFFWKSMLENIKQWNHMQNYIEKIEKYTPRLAKLSKASIDWDPEAFNVIIHADFWANNIMFQYSDTGDVKDVQFVDWQLSRWGSPVQDLQYFLISSIEADLKPAKFDALIRHYYDELVANLKLLEYKGKIPRLLDIHTEILKRGFTSVYVAFTVFPVISAAKNDESTAENLLEEHGKGNDFRKNVYCNPNYISQMEKLLPYFENRGWLDL